jgi:hypothetical protein
VFIEDVQRHAGAVSSCDAYLYFTTFGVRGTYFPTEIKVFVFVIERQCFL